MANVLGELFQNIADAIRSKTGSTDTLKPNQFPEAIEGITAGGGGGGSADGFVTVTFMNGDVELFKRPVYIGDDCPEPVEQGRFDAPTKESTAQYNYTFYGWGASDGGAANANILKNITEDKTVYAIFTATVRYYTITWLDDDGTELPGQKQWAYGTIPSYTPTKEGVSFDKWIPTPTKVTGDASYTAVWKSVIASGTCGTNARWEIDANYVLTILGTGAMTTYSSTDSLPWKAYLDKITAIVVEDGITGIGKLAFSQCTNVTSATIADSVTSIGHQAFSQCSKLENVVLPNSVASFESHVFYMCTNLKSIVIPGSVAKIANQMFMRSGLEDVTIENGVTEIGTQTFLGCGGLKSIVIPSSVATIGSSAFESCGNLTSVTFKETNGWSVGSTVLSATDLSNTATAATYLTKTYRDKWNRT